MAWSSGGWGEVPWGGEANTTSLVVEAGAALDTPSTKLSAQATVFERGVNDEMVSAGVNVGALVREQAAGIDKQTATQQLTVGVVEAAAGLDVPSTQLSAIGLILEQGTAQDFMTAVSAILADIVEGGVSSDRFTTAEFYEFLCLEVAGMRAEPTDSIDMAPLFVFEGAEGGDASSVTVDMSVNIIERGTIRDIAGARYRWEPVLDGQTGTWVPVIDTQPGPWTPVIP